ncbi:MAG: tetratricopeptide repeat protein [Lysobacteraceae bacterium]
MTRMFSRSIAGGLIAAGVALAGCSGPPPTQQAMTKKPPAPELDVLAVVRAAGADAKDTFEVQPLRDPVIADLRQAAAQHETARDWRRADAALEQALALSPGDPELLQWRAELALVQGDYNVAVELANASWEQGPRLGALCRRNWTTVRLVRELTDYPAAAHAAAEQLARCTHEPPVRM